MPEQTMNMQLGIAAAVGDEPEHVGRVRALNDALRRNLIGGRVVMTAGVVALPGALRAAVLDAVQGFDAFDATNDPHGEHDFGALTVEGGYAGSLDHRGHVGPEPLWA